MTDPTTDPDYLALLASVLTRPGDDLPRLALADWLDEHADMVQCPECELKPGEVNHPPGLMFVGYGLGWQPCSTCNGSARVSNGFAERAEFIRIQCELAKCRPDCDPGKICRVNQSCPSLRKIERFWIEMNRKAIQTAYHPFTIGLARQGLPEGNQLLFRRGFIESVTCSLDVLLGPGCPVCEEFGRPIDDIDECSTCGGTGRGQGIAAKLFAAHPVTRVTLTSCPSASPDQGFIWVSREGGERGVAFPNRCYLPMAIFSRLKAYVQMIDVDVPSVSYKCAAYYTDDLAIDDLSSAIVSLGRELAGVQVEVTA